MKYLYVNKHWSIHKEYNLDKLLYLMIDRPNKTYYKDFVWNNNKNQIHREYDLPSHVVCFNNNELCFYWNKNNKIHRKNDKPAYINFSGYKKYYISDTSYKEEWVK